MNPTLDNSDSEGATPPLLLLVHGLGRTTLSMRSVEREGKRRGYSVINWSYPSRRRSIQEHASALDSELSPILRMQHSRVDFVTHSLGGLIIREYLRTRVFPNFGRVVMLAPPNRGTEVVDALGSLRLFKFVTGKPGRELGTRLPDEVQKWTAVNVELGVIAGSDGLNPLFARWLPTPHDGTVSVARTMLDGMSDFIVLRCGHTFMPSKRNVLDQIFAFMLTGKFSRPGTGAPVKSGELASSTSD